MSKTVRLRNSKGQFMKAPRQIAPKGKYNTFSIVKAGKPARTLKTQARIKSRMETRGLRAAERTQIDTIRQQQHQRNLNKGGLKGMLARAREKRITKHQERIQRIKDKTNILREQAQTKMKTDAKVKEYGAKYGGYAAVATALGSGYSSGEGFKSYGKAKQAEAEQKAAEALENLAGSAAPQLDSEGNVRANAKTVSGLASGVR